MRFQIQPTAARMDEYIVLAGKYGFTFEVLEHAMFPNARFPEEKYLSSGLVTAVHGAFIDVNPAGADEELRLLSRKRCRESCAIAEKLGAESIVFHSSCFPFLRGGYMEKWAENCAEFYVSLAEKTGLDVFIENSFDIDPAPLAALMKAAGGRLGVCLDIGHANYSGTPLCQWTESLAQYIGYIHLSDNRGKYDDHLPLGDGTVNWKQAGELLSFLPAGVPATLETGDADGIIRSAAFLKENGLFGM